MKVNFYTTLFFLFVSLLGSNSFGQATDSAQLNKRTHFELEAQVTGTSGNVIPFWIRSNQFGNIPLPSASSSFLARATRDFNGPGGRKLDWGWGVEGRVNTTLKNTTYVLPEAFVKVKAGPLQLQGGRTKESMGLVGDSILSSGSFSISGNALGIPQLELSIPEYYFLPFFKNLIAIKGNFSHGWLGKTRILDTIRAMEPSNARYAVGTNRPVTFFHQKSFYGRFGRDDWNINLYGGFNHQVYWGSEKEIFGSHFTLTPLETFGYVVTGFPYGYTEKNRIQIPRSKIGNMLGSIDVGLLYKFKKVNLMLYRQNIYDVGALYYLANLRDGLNGLILTNRQSGKATIQWEKIVFEYFSSKHQAGEFNSKATPSGDEDYYNNYFYLDGWSYKGTGLGTPFISTRNDTRKNLPSNPYADYFINNRVKVFHLGLQGKVSGYLLRSKVSYSENYGTFATSPEGHSTGKVVPTKPIFGLFGKVRQFSSWVEVVKNLNPGTTVGASFAFDHGNLLYKAHGVSVRLIKKLEQSGS